MWSRAIGIQNGRVAKTSVFILILYWLIYFREVVEIQEA